MMREKHKLYMRIIVNLLICTTLLILTIIFLPKLLVFFMPFVIAVIISAIANPLVNFLEKKVKILRKFSSAVIIILVLGFIFALIYLLILLLIRIFRSFTSEINNIVDAFLAFIDDFQASVSGTFRLPESVSKFLLSLDENLEDLLTNFAASAVDSFSLEVAGDYLSSAVNVLILAIITILATYFLMIDRNKIGETIKKIVPQSVQECYNLAMTTIKTAIGGYLKAQLKLMVIIFLILWLGFKLLDVEYALLIAIITAILDFLPVFGTGTIIGPWTVVKILTGDYLTAVFLVIIYLVCLLIKQLLQPKMVGDSVGLSAFTALICMFIGYQISGILGMIIGIPIGMILIGFYRAGFFDRLIRGMKIILTDINEFRKF